MAFASLPALPIQASQQGGGGQHISGATRSLNHDKAADWNRVSKKSSSVCLFTLWPSHSTPLHDHELVTACSPHCKTPFSDQAYPCSQHLKYAPPLKSKFTSKGLWIALCAEVPCVLSTCQSSMSPTPTQRSPQPSHSCTSGEEPA